MKLIIEEELIEQGDDLWLVYEEKLEIGITKDGFFFLI